MKYLFLNQFSFENPKKGLSEDDILSVFTNLGLLLKNLKQERLFSLKVESLLELMLGLF